MKTCLWIILATVAFLIAFYSSAGVMKITHPLDFSLLTF